MIWENREKDYSISFRKKAWKSNTTRMLSGLWDGRKAYMVLTPAFSSQYTMTDIRVEQFTEFLKTFEARNKRCSNLVLVHIWSTLPSFGSLIWFLSIWQREEITYSRLCKLYGSMEQSVVRTNNHRPCKYLFSFAGNWARSSECRKGNIVVLVKW